MRDERRAEHNHVPVAPGTGRGIGSAREDRRSFELPYGHLMTEALESAPLLCHPCCLLRGQVHRAWTVFGGVSPCLWCAVEQQAGDDDMVQHDLMAGLYEQLRLLGHSDAY